MCGSIIRRILSVETRLELSAIFHLSWPIAFFQLFEVLLMTITVIFCGHLGKEELAGVSFAISLVNTTGYTLGYGLLSAVDTLASQSFGANNKLRVGVIVQRAIIILSLACLPIWGLWLNSERISSFIIDDRKVTEAIGMFMDIFLPALPAMFLFTTLMKYMENQEIVRPLLLVGSLACIMHVIYDYVLIYVLNYGVRGAAIGAVLGNVTLALMTLGYIHWKKLHVDTWGGWSKDCLQDWNQFYHFAIPGMVMVCADWWSFEVGTLMMSSQGDAVLAAQGIMTQVVVILYNLPYAIGIAINVRVGIFLGKGKPEHAKFISKLGLHIAWIFACLQIIILVTTRNYMAYIFTSNKEVIHLTSKALVLFATPQIMLWCAIIGQGIARGTGFLKIGALINIMSQSIIATLLGACLVFVVKMKLVGLWIGYAVGVFIMGCGYLIVVSRINWREQAKQARTRAGVHDTETENLIDREGEVVATYGTVNNNESIATVEIIQKSLINNSASVNTYDDSSLSWSSILLSCIVTFFSIALFVVGLVCRLIFPTRK